MDKAQRDGWLSVSLKAANDAGFQAELVEGGKAITAFLPFLPGHDRQGRSLFWSVDVLLPIGPAFPILPPLFFGVSLEGLTAQARRRVPSQVERDGRAWVRFDADFVTAWTPSSSPERGMSFLHLLNRAGRILRRELA